MSADAKTSDIAIPAFLFEKIYRSRRATVDDDLAFSGSMSKKSRVSRNCLFASERKKRLFEFYGE
jgi:hypothetical protein